MRAIQCVEYIYLGGWVRGLGDANNISWGIVSEAVVIVSGLQARAVAAGNEAPSRREDYRNYLGIIRICGDFIAVLGQVRS